MNIYYHTGNNGDILFCLTFITECRDIDNIEPDEFFIHTNVNMKYYEKHPNCNVGMTKKAAEFITPLLEYTNIFKKVIFNDVFHSINKEDIFLNLSEIRKFPINFSSGNIARWYYSLYSNHLPQDFSKPTVIIKDKDIDTTYKDKIIVSKTNRYNNVFLNWKSIEQFKDDLVFVGLEDEYNAFCKENFIISEYRKVNDMLELAKLLAGCKAFIGNQSGNYSLAEVMKIPRVLCTPEYMKTAENKIVPGPVNNQPCGGWFEVVNHNMKFKNIVEILLKK